MAQTIEIEDGGRRIAYAFDDLMRFHGPASPGGVALAFKALERALPLLHPGEPCPRREVTVTTAFGGPGARDAFEMVLRAVSDDRFTIDEALTRPELGRARERFVFRLERSERAVTVMLRDGFVGDEFIDLARTEGRSADQERRLDLLKSELADRVMAQPASKVYDAD